MNAEHSEASGMKVVPLASSTITYQGWDLFYEVGFDPFRVPGEEGEYQKVTDGDIIGEFAGRNCYLSHNKPNPSTAHNDDYLANILEIEHESILEHTSVSFYVSGVSRNLLLELERHRHISFSVVSTRYVSPGKMGTVIHPNTPVNMRADIRDLDTKARLLADNIFNECKRNGLDQKQSREVARQVLPGNTETKMVVTGNLRAWRYIVNLRAHSKADAEIQLFAAEILKGLKMVAPNSVQDL